MRIARAVSIVNFGVAMSALNFQIFVLYPWHHQLSDDFEDLKKEHLRVFDAINRLEKKLDLEKTEVRQERAPPERGLSLLERAGWGRKY